MKRLAFLIGVSLLGLNLLGQIKETYKVETFGSAATGEHTPFWLVSQQWGVTALTAPNFYLRAGAFHEQTLNRDWSWQAGIDVVSGNDAPYGNVWLQQIYGRVNWKSLRLDVGSREDYLSFLNPYLSSGDWINSNNSRPHPQIKGSIPDFLLVPYTKGNFFIKGDIALGAYLDGKWQEDRALPYSRSYTKNALSHNKAIYFRFGDMENRHKMQFTAGMIHAAQWGGTIYKYHMVNGQWEYTATEEPRNLDNLLRVMIAKEGGEGASGASKAYAAGSHWGGYILKYDYKLNTDDRISAYIHHFFDDGSGMAFENYRDNVLGLEFHSHKKNLLSGVVMEYIYSKQQTGPIHFNMEMDDEHRDKLISKGNGNDNYYNNTDYAQGNSYYGKSMGTPLLLSPEYNTDHSLEFKGNRISAFHLGVEGYLQPSLQYRALMTVGRNLGRYYLPFRSEQKGLASRLELIYNCPRWEGWTVRLTGGYDEGEFFGGNTFGGGLSISKQGVLYAK
ncbi:MAG: capsule assembly Wzi family protein [Dysgonamonadaceae bacterium]|jgi:hypothetical protein|nr:capsule assembly Wzi family protein [Dysgonamonadaceae bacterium]